LALHNTKSSEHVIEIELFMFEISEVATTGETWQSASESFEKPTKAVTLKHVTLILSHIAARDTKEQSLTQIKRQDHRDHAAFVVKIRRYLHGLRRACALFLYIESSTYLQWPLRVDSASVEIV
jgi:hypothetical protein